MREALDQRLSDLAQVKKSLLIRLETTEREIQELYRLRYETIGQENGIILPPVEAVI